MRSTAAAVRSAALWVVPTLAAALAFLATPWARAEAAPDGIFWIAMLAFGALAIAGLRKLAALEGRPLYATLTATVFGLWILFFWQVLVVAMEVPRVLLPAPWLILQSLVDNIGTLGNDFATTVLQAVLVGWALGCGLGFLVAIAIDRMPFLQRGLLPVASLTSTIPLVGVAPIAVMVFGFGWPSKAAVVVLMTFFPMLVSTLAGLQASMRIERELMHSYAAGYCRTLWSLRLPTALPFMFSALKINATLALIGAIVAEFFGSTTSGLGFRISTEATKMNMTLVWAAVVVAAVTGSVAYALLVALERRAAFWHPSIRGQR